VRILTIFGNFGGGGGDIEVIDNLERTLIIKW
jgi:hypothetical protein